MKTPTTIYTRILVIIAIMSLAILAGSVCYELYKEHKGDLAEKEHNKELELLATKKRYPYLGAMPGIGVKEAKIKTKFISGEIFYSMLLVTSNKSKVLEQAAYRIQLLDADGFKIQEIQVPIDGLVKSVDENGEIVGFMHNSSMSMEEETYKSIKDWALIWTTK